MHAHRKVATSRILLLLTIGPPLKGLGNFRGALYAGRQCGQPGLEYLSHGFAAAEIVHLSVILDPRKYLGWHPARYMDHSHGLVAAHVFLRFFDVTVPVEGVLHVLNHFLVPSCVGFVERCGCVGDEIVFLRGSSVLLNSPQYPSEPARRARVDLG